MNDEQIDKLARLAAADGGWAWRRRGAARRLGRIASPEAIRALATIVTSTSDEQVTAIAHQAFAGLTDQAAIDAVCEVWADTRAVALGASIGEHGWVATRPAALRVLTALHSEQLSVLVSGGPDVARALVTAAADEQPPLHDRARAVLAGLSRQDARDAVCALAIEHGDEAALDAALAGGFVPSDPARRAALLFLAGDFDVYAELDFDGSLLRSVPAVAHDRVRARLAWRARESGRVEWIRVVAGARSGRGLADLPDGDWSPVVDALVAAGRWEELWRLATETTPVRAVELLRELDQRQWRPAAESERASFEELTALARECRRKVPDALLPDEPTLVARGTGGLAALTATPDWSLLAGAYADGTVRLWELPSGEPAGVLSDHEGPVNCLAVTPDGRLLASAGQDGMIRLWDLPSRALAVRLSGHEGPVGCLVVTPGGGQLASGGSDTNVRLWRLPSGVPAGVLSGHEGLVECLVVTHDGGRLISASVDGTSRLWRLPSGAPAGKHYVRERGIRRRLAVTPDSRQIAVGDADGNVMVSRIGVELRNMYLSSHEYRVTSLVVTADGGLLASGARNGRIRLWQLPSGEPVAAMSRHPSGVACLAAGPDGNLLASGGPDGVRLWRLPSGDPAGVLCGAEHPVGFLMLNRDGQLLVSGGDDGQIRLWRLTRLTEVSRTAAPDLDPAEAERLVRGSRDRPGPERDWALMIAALVRRWHRYDIEVAAVEPGTGPGATDIDLDRAVEMGWEDDE